MWTRTCVSPPHSPAIPVNIAQRHANDIQVLTIISNACPVIVAGPSTPPSMSFTLVLSDLTVSTCSHGRPTSSDSSASHSGGMNIKRNSPSFLTHATLLPTRPVHPHHGPRRPRRSCRLPSRVRLVVNVTTHNEQRDQGRLPVLRSRHSSFQERYLP